MLRALCARLPARPVPAHKGQDALVLDLPMTRTDTADFLDLETTSRTFTKLKLAG
jgi:hypothetical protein